MYIVHVRVGVHVIMKLIKALNELFLCPSYSERSPNNSAGTTKMLQTIVQVTLPMHMHVSVHGTYCTVKLLAELRREGVDYGITLYMYMYLLAIA